MWFRRCELEKDGREGGTILFNWLQNVGGACDAVARYTQLPVSTPGLARRSRLLLRDHRAPAPAPAQVLVLMAMLVNSNGTAACTAATTTS